MYKSKYTIEVNVSDDLILYNSLSGAILLINEHKYKNYDSLLDNEEKETLKELGFLIDEPEAEYSDFLSEYNKDMDNMLYCDFTIALTMNCNFDCPYCYENKNQYVMSDSMIDKLIDFIQNSSIGKNELSITWYGGEPMLLLNKIAYISEKLIKFCEQNIISFSAEMITNGYLMSKKYIEILKICKINTFQITLDGFEKNHDKYRFPKNSKNESTFYQIVDNIDFLNRSGFKTVIRIKET